MRIKHGSTGVSSDIEDTDLARHLNTRLITLLKRLLLASVKCSFCHILEPDNLEVMVRQAGK